MTDSTNVLDKAITFKTVNIPHPDGKKSKKTGDILKVTQYHYNDKVYSTSDVITLDKQHRFLISSLSKDELAEVKAMKGDKALRDIMMKFHAACKKIVNTSRNTGVKLDADKVEATDNFIRVLVSEALDKLKGVKDQDTIALPF